MTYHFHCEPAWGRQTSKAPERMQGWAEPDPHSCPYRVGAMIFCTVVLVGAVLAVVSGATASRECRGKGGVYLQHEQVCLKREGILGLRP